MSITEFTGLSFEEVKEIALSKNQPAFRAKQLFNWVYRKKIFDFSAMKNLPDSLIMILDP
ncbi:MAG: hypothetical protein PF545_05380 [Elusimicrobia bacterium]|jgi:23S rRNA (adenine2503-C2)-methyltransferase|nr:hypothetical protein [Elusimicrobiota bacterium]